MKWCLTIGLFLLTAQTQVPFAEIEARVPFAPMPVEGSDGSTHLAYELHITNYYESTGVLKLDHVDVLADKQSTPLLSFTDGRMIQGGAHTVVFIWVTLPKGQPQPSMLHHRATFVNLRGAEEMLDGAAVVVRREQPVILGPPLRGGIWLAHEGPGNPKTHHWGSQLALNGRVMIPQRFAMDLIGLDASGNALRTDPQKSSNEDWVGFGTEVLAVANGIVRDTYDGTDDNKPLTPLAPDIPMTAQALYGNYIVLEIAAGTFAQYAHLQPKSVKIKKGDRVRRGQLLARLGDSGNSNAPHLHFQVSDGPTFDTEGLPFVFEGFDLLGKTTADRAIGSVPNPDTSGFTSERRRREIPLNDVVIRF